MATSLTAYCVRCKARRELAEPQPVYAANARPAVRGRCPVCGGRLFRPGWTELHQALPQPEPKKGRVGEATKAKNKLVVVESPTKAQTLGRFLGKDYRVAASLGHVRDLLKSRLSVDVEDNFRPTYRVPNEKKKVVKALGQAAERAGSIYLATDPDREGEAIAWHLWEALGAPEKPCHRVAFHEVTKEAVEEAFAHPRDLDMDLVNAQQARRILDRLVGYNLGPLLWKNVRAGLSAGRVQSAALRLVVEREREIEAFVPQEYWSILARLARLGPPEGQPFPAELVRVGDEKPEPASQGEAEDLVRALREAAYRVSAVGRRDRLRHPQPPFTTSSLQQEASRRLGFSPSRTMRLAQELYEGVPLGREGRVGLITYMRTDAVNISPQAQRAAQSYIREAFGRSYCPARPPRYRSRAKHAQEAHEAIRPTVVVRTPAQLKGGLSQPQWRLYQLILTRFLASQMAAAVFDTISVDIEAGGAAHWPYLFRATASKVRFLGYLAVYQRELGEAPEEDPEHEALLELVEGEALRLLDLVPEQHFTQPPPRYTEATLVRELEEKGIGRPSTYAPTLSTLRERSYVALQERRLHPTELGMVVNDLLMAHFPDVVDIGFTARMEEDLDLIAEGAREWTEVLREFYLPFAASLAEAGQRMRPVALKPQYTGELCELCASPLVVKVGRFGKFIACSSYPACRNTKPFALKLGIHCPECGGELVEKASRRGRTFYGCGNYPQCRFATRQRPVAAPCPRCGGLVVEEGRGRRRCLSCKERVPRGEELEEQVAHL